SAPARAPDSRAGLSRLRSARVPAPASAPLARIDRPSVLGSQRLLAVAVIAHAAARGASTCARGERPPSFMIGGRVDTPGGAIRALSPPDDRPLATGLDSLGAKPVTTFDSPRPVQSRATPQAR